MLKSHSMFYLLQETGRIEENEYAYVDEFSVIPRAAVWDNTLNHHRDQLLVEQGYAISNAIPGDIRQNKKDQPNETQLSSNRSHSLGSMGDVRGIPAQYFTLEPAGPDVAVGNQQTMMCVPRGGMVGDYPVDNHYQIQDTFPRQMQTFKS